MVLVQVSVTLLGLVLLCGLHKGDALKCFECNSHNDSTCAEKNPPTNLQKDCSEHAGGPKYVLCRKIVQYIDFEVNGNMPEKRVIRSCGWDESSYKNRCYQRSGFGGRQEVCACDQDNCNSAPHIILPTTLSVILAMLSVHRWLF